MVEHHRVMWDHGSAAHAAPHYVVTASQPKGSWQLSEVPLGARCVAIAAGAGIEVVGRLLQAASQFIELFPSPSKRLIDVLIGGRGEGWVQDFRLAILSNSGVSRTKDRGGGGSEASGQSAAERRAAQAEAKLAAKHDFLQQVRRRIMSENKVAPPVPKPNRLDDSMTEEMVRCCANAIYDSLDLESGFSAYIVSGMEAMLMAWDLLSEIDTAWRVPLTIVSRRDNRQYTYASVLLLMDGHVGALGRSRLAELCHLPLAQRKVSEIVTLMVEALARRDHDVVTLYLGVPAPCPVPLREANERRCRWRYLKLSCARQRWQSVLGTIDHFVAHRSEVRRAAAGLAPLPLGFGPLLERAAEAGPPPRICAIAPMLVRRRRPRRPVQEYPDESEDLPEEPTSPVVASARASGVTPKQSASPARRASGGPGTWELEAEDAAAARLAAGPETWGLPALGGGHRGLRRRGAVVVPRPRTAGGVPGPASSPTEGTPAASRRPSMSGSASGSASASVGGAVKPHMRGVSGQGWQEMEELFEQARENAGNAVDPTCAELDECSSVSDASLEEWLEDNALDTAQAGRLVSEMASAAAAAKADMPRPQRFAVISDPAARLAAYGTSPRKTPRGAGLRPASAAVERGERPKAHLSIA